MFKEFDTLALFFDEPTREFNVREVGRLLRIAPASASKRLKEFARRSILKERKERQLLLYRADIDSSYYRDLKVFFNIRRLKDSRFLEAVNDHYLKPTVILFGSYATGYDIENSDIDLVIISEKVDQMDVKTYSRKLKRTVQLLPVKRLEDLKNPNLMNNVLNGIKLQGMVKWI
jgi:predicted nucleotidyltransferase